MKKGNLLTEFFVKIVLALLMVGLLIWFTVAIWNALFPGEDAATLKSFESLADAIAAQGNKNTPASFVNTQIYFADSSYKILLFDKEKLNYSETWNVESLTYLKPSSCKGSTCLCLYKGKLNPEDEDENVVRCKIYSSNVVFKRFDLTDSTGKTINQRNHNKFYTVIIFQNKTGDSINEIQVILNLNNNSKQNQDTVKSWVSERNKIN